MTENSELFLHLVESVRNTRTQNKYYEATRISSSSNLDV